MLDSALIIGLLAIIVTVLSVNVTRVRMKTNILFGDGGNDLLAKARRAHFTVVEYSLIFCVTLVVYETIGGDRSLVVPLGFGFILTRLMHMAGMFMKNPKNLGRGLGSLGSHLIVLFLAVKTIILHCTVALGL